MYKFFQNLKKADRSKRWFHFRGSFGPDYNSLWLKYEVCSGFEFRLKVQHGECCDDDASTRITFGLLFFTVYLTFFLPKSWYFKRKCIATWENNREFYLVEGRQYGFYFFEWAFVWSWQAKVNESSAKDPWWMRQYIHIDEIFLGKWERLEDKLATAEDVWFSIGGKEFKMDSIVWERNRSFRRFIPYSLFHRTWYSVKMDIKKPPMYSGKGENSWDCGDDGSFGLSAPWKFDVIPGWLKYDEAARLAVGYYVDHIMKNVKRYGGSSGERGINSNDEYKFIGFKREKSA